MRRFAIAAALMLCVVAVGPASAGARTSKSAFQVFVEPTISAARDGFTLETELEGSFDVANKTATGDGSDTVMNGSTVIDSGTFTLTRLVAFQFYGCGEVEGTALPPDFCGGRVIFRFHATSTTGEETVGLYEVNCQIHDPGGKTPRGTSEGVKANARGINFNKHVTGDNLFVMLP
jgi:hypothetical protein